MKTKVIRMKRRRRVDLRRAGVDRTASMMAMFGFSARCIAEACGFASPSLVYYRNRQANLRLTDFRNGKSPMAILVLQKLRGAGERILDEHLERQVHTPHAMRIHGIRMQLPAYVQKEML